MPAPVNAHNESPSLDPEYLSFVSLFNDRQYELSNQTLMPLWQANVSNRFYKGLIQLAGAYQHWSTGNAFWTEDLFASAYNLLKNYAPLHKGLDVERLLDEIEACNQVARRAKEAGELSPTEEMPQIQLVLKE